MENLIYLGIAAAVFIVGCGFVLLRHRQRPTTFGSSIDRFKHEMGALNPTLPPERRRQRSGTRRR
jgi:hypothetical protein